MGLFAERAGNLVQVVRDYLHRRLLLLVNPTPDGQQVPGYGLENSVAQRLSGREVDERGGDGDTFLASDLGMSAASQPTPREHLDACLEKTCPPLIGRQAPTLGCGWVRSRHRRFPEFPD